MCCFSHSRLKSQPPLGLSSNIQFQIRKKWNENVIQDKSRSRKSVSRTTLVKSLSGMKTRLATSFLTGFNPEPSDSKNPTSTIIPKCIKSLKRILLFESRNPPSSLPPLAHSNFMILQLLYSGPDLAPVHTSLCLEPEAAFSFTSTHVATWSINMINQHDQSLSLSFSGASQSPALHLSLSISLSPFLSLSFFPVSPFLSLPFQHLSQWHHEMTFPSDTVCI